MRYQVPQFIDLEDKIFGPLTFKQFVYLAGPVGICVVLVSFLPKIIAYLLCIPVLVLGVCLAFVKVNGKPFISVFESFIKYTTGSKLYIWQKTEKEAVAKTLQSPLAQVEVPKLSESRLKDLAWELDIKENQNPVTRSEENKI
jgi:hypothetical protein